MAELHVGQLELGLPLLFMSCLAMVFSSVTMSLSESGVLQQDYTPDSMEQAALWDFLFWLYFLVSHLISALILTTPVDLYAVMLGVVFLVYFTHRGCAPRQRTATTVTKENLNILGYGLGIVIIAYNIPDGNTERSACLVVILMLDYALGMGHTFDLEPTMDTVANCRLLNICAVSLCMCCLYAVSGSLEHPGAQIHSVIA